MCCIGCALMAKAINRASMPFAARDAGIAQKYRQGWLSLLAQSDHQRSCVDHPARPVGVCLPTLRKKRELEDALALSCGGTPKFDDRDVVFLTKLLRRSGDVPSGTTADRFCTLKSK